MRLTRLPLAIVLALLATAAVPAARAETVTVFAAASLTDALTAIAEAYEAETGDALRLSFAASSTLARQIEAGAPAQIYASANERWMDHLETAGLIEPDSRVSPIANRLVLVATADTAPPPMTVDADLDLAGLLGPDGRLALGDPAHVPAGLYARQALEHLGLWAEVAPRLAAAADVRAALALVDRGEAPLGIVYATDAAITDGIAVVGTFPADSHDPITYPFALVAGEATPAARAFFEYLTGPEAAALLAAAGFTVR
jgi:molybdate transport system substrate-binding protein